MPFPRKLREQGLPAEVSGFPAKTSRKGDFEVSARQLDDGLCCLTENVAVQLHRRRCSL